MEGNTSRRVSLASPIPAPSSIRRSACESTQDRVVVVGICGEALPAAVRDRHGGLQQQEALFRVRRIDARNTFALDLGGEHLVGAAFHHPFVIISRVEGAGGEFETALTFYASVARCAVAATLGKQPR